MDFKFINQIIQKFGKSGYTVDRSISLLNMLIILKDKFFELARGFIKKIYFKKTEGFIFIGKRTNLKHCNLITTGRTLFIGDNVSINALSKNGIQFGKNISIHRNTIIDCTGGIRSLGEGLTVGNNVGFSPNCFIQVRGTVRIGNNVIFGPGVKLFSETHNFNSIELPILQQGETRIGVIIEDNVWIGADAIILDGVIIGRDSIIAAGSLINRSIEPYSIVAGVPGKLIKKRV